MILRRSRFELAKARERAHLLVGLAIAVANIDEVIRVIRASPDATVARTELMARAWPAGDIGALLALIDDSGNLIVGEPPDQVVHLTDAQARGILELRLARLTGLERDKIQAELTEVAARITELLDIIGSRPRRLEVMRDELVRGARRDRHAADDRHRRRGGGPGRREPDRAGPDGGDHHPRRLHQAHRAGRVPPAGPRRARPLGAGMRGDDIVTRSFNAHTHQWVLFFSSGGKAFREKVWRLPEAQPAAKGRALVNLLPELGGDTITTVLPLPQDEALWDNLHLLFATASGGVRRNKLSDFGRVRSSGLIAMKLDEGDHLIGVATCREGDDVLLATRRGRCIRFPVTDDVVRVFAGRDSAGVRGIRLAAGDEVISLSVLQHVEASPHERAAFLRGAAARRRAQGEEVDASVEADADAEDAHADESGEVGGGALAELGLREELLLTVTDAGFGKRSSSYDYRVTGRGGSGIANILLGGRKGTAVVGTFPCGPATDVMLVTDAGRLIRISSDGVRITGRQATGVTLFRVSDGERVSAVFPVVEAVAGVDDAAADEADAAGSDGSDPGEDDGADTERTRLPEASAAGPPHRHLPRHVRPGAQRPPGHHRPGGAHPRPPGDRRGRQRRQGAAVPVDERVELVRAETQPIAARTGTVIEVTTFGGLLIDFARRAGATVIVRGLRAVTDFDYEFQMAGMNYRLDHEIEPVFLMASETHQFIASRFVKEIARLGGDISSFVPALTLERTIARVRPMAKGGPRPPTGAPDGPPYFPLNDSDRNFDERRSDVFCRGAACAGPAEHAVHGPQGRPGGDPPAARPGAQACRAGQAAGARAFLRRHRVPPGDRRVHGAGRRPDRHRHGRQQDTRTCRPSSARPRTSCAARWALRGRRARTRPTASSTSASRRRRSWMGSTRSGDRWCPEWSSWTRSRRGPAAAARSAIPTRS